MERTLCRKVDGRWILVDDLLKAICAFRIGDKVSFVVGNHYFTATVYSVAYLKKGLYLVFRTDVEQMIFPVKDIVTMEVV